MRQISKALTAAALVMLAAPAFAQDAPGGNIPLSTGQPAPAGAAPAPELPKSRADAQPRQPYEIGTFSEWTVRCVRVDEAPSDPCEMGQVLKNTDGQPTVEFSLYRIKREGVEAAATIVTPLETLLTRNVTLAADGTQGKVYPFTFCTRQGCVAQIGFTADEIAAFKKGSAATVTIYPVAAPDRPVQLKVSLAGFTAAYDSLTGLPGIP